MSTGLRAVTDLAVFLHENQSVRVFKVTKTEGYSGEYIVVNHLPFVFGKAVNDDNILNVNIHIPTLNSGSANVPRMEEVFEIIADLIPIETEEEDKHGLELNGSYYYIHSVSQPIEDKDNTFYLNVKIKVIINGLKL